MSKKAINAAREQVEASGFLAGRESFLKTGSTLDYRADVVKYSEALSMLGLMGLADAYEMLSDLYYEANDAGYMNAKCIAEYKAGHDLVKNVVASF
jgi:hypothetical protein